VRIVVATVAPTPSAPTAVSAPGADAVLWDAAASPAGAFAVVWSDIRARRR
jgi:hypothetical protein